MEEEENNMIALLYNTPYTASYNASLNKNPVGRPKKRKNHNIMRNNVNINSDVELVKFTTLDLQLIKQIIQLFKQLNKINIYISFEESNIKLFNYEPNESGMIQSSLELSELYSYNYKQDITISCITHKLNDILNNVNSNYEIISFSVTEDTNLKIEMINTDVEERCIDYLPIDIKTNITHDIHVNFMKHNDNVIRFAIPVKMLKKKLSVFNKITKYLILEYDGSAVKFNVEPDDKWGKHITQYTNLRKLQFLNVPNIAEFKIGINFKDILHFSNLSLTDKIHFIIVPNVQSIYCATSGGSVSSHTTIIKIPVEWVLPN